MKHTLWIALILLHTFVGPSLGARLTCPKPDKDNERNKSIARRYYKLGLLFQKKNDVVRFIDAYKCVLTLVPYSVNARFKYAEALDQAKQYSEAVVRYKDFITVAKNRELIQRARARIAAIKNLPDEPLPVDPYEGKSSQELKQIRRAYEIKSSKEFKARVAQIEAEFKGKPELDKELLKYKREFQKARKKTLAELDKQLKRVTALEQIDRRNKVLVKYIKSSPVSYTEFSTLRKWGIGTGIAGIVLGLSAVGTFIWKMRLTDDLNSAGQRDKSGQDSDLTTEGIGYGDIGKQTWSSSSAKSKYDSIDLLGSAGIGLGIAAGVLVVAGTTLFFMGETKRVVIKHDVEVKNFQGEKRGNTLSFQFAPLLTPKGGGLALETRW